jgi:DNA-binding transcriptional regulator YbjK
VYKTKYRKISLFNKLRSTKIKYFKDIDKLILKNSKNFLNKNSTIVSKFYAKYKDIDFLTDRIRSYQFTNRVSKFYQKNL